MKRWLFFTVVVGLLACDNNAKVEAQADSLGKIKDSVKAKGERTLKDVKDKISDLQKRDSVSKTIK